MSSLELRIIGYALVALMLITGSAWSGHKLTALHYDAIIAKDKLAQATLAEAAQQRVIDAQTKQKQAEDDARQDHEKLVQANAKLSGDISSSVHDIALSFGNFLSTSVADRSGVPGSSPGTTGDPELTAILGRLGTALEATTTACLADSARLTGILEQYAKVSH